MIQCKTYSKIHADVTSFKMANVQMNIIQSIFKMQVCLFFFSFFKKNVSTKIFTCVYNSLMLTSNNLVSAKRYDILSCHEKKNIILDT